MFDGDEAGGGDAAATTAPVPAPAPAPANAAAAADADLVPGKRLLLDVSESIDMTVPSVELVLGLGDGTEKRFVKIDEDRVPVDEELAALLFDEETLTEKDLVPRKYEGGLKVWEASLDLVRYLHRLLTTGNHPLFCAAGEGSACGGEGGAISAAHAADAAARRSGGPALRVLELGCGHGFPAIYVLQEANVRHCVFSDYNEAVLRGITWPTVLSNCLGHGRSGSDVDLRFRARYYAGDWVRMRKPHGDLGCLLVSSKLMSVVSQWE